MYTRKPIILSIVLLLLVASACSLTGNSETASPIESSETATLETSQVISEPTIIPVATTTPPNILLAGRFFAQYISDNKVLGVWIYVDDVQTGKLDGLYTTYVPVIAENCQFPDIVSGDAVDAAGSWNGKGIDICVDGGYIKTRANLGGSEDTTSTFRHYRGVIQSRVRGSDYNGYNLLIETVFVGNPDEKGSTIQTRNLDWVPPIVINNLGRDLVPGDSVEVFGGLNEQNFLHITLIVSPIP